MAESPDRTELKAQWKTEVEVPHMKLTDVKQHSSKTDLWIIIHGKVYDVTQYARDHPGGADALLELAGQDATSAYEDVGHSEDAREIMHPFLVGTLDDTEATPAPSKPAVQIVRRGPEKPQPVSSAISPQLELAMGTAGALAVVLGLYHSHALPAIPHAPGGFTAGFLWSSAVSTAVAALGYRRFRQLMSFGQGSTSMPAHLDADNAVTSVNRPSGILLPQEYQKFPLIRKDELSKDTVRLVFKLPKKTSVLGLPIGQHVAIRGYYDDGEGHHTVTRSYTPVSNNKDLGRLELVIKLYSDGKLTGGYLQGVQLGDEVEFRGPKGAMRYRKGMSKSIGMVAGGTGITPMYQLIRAICEDKTDDTQVDLIYANKTPADILLKDQLERYTKMAPTQFRVHLVIDKMVPGWQGSVGYVDKKMLEEKLPAASPDTKILLCGPPGMVNAAKKNLVELGFEAPGAVTRLTDQVFLF